MNQSVNISCTSTKLNTVIYFEKIQNCKNIQWQALVISEDIVLTKVAFRKRTNFDLITSNIFMIQLITNDKWRGTR